MPDASRHADFLPTARWDVLRLRAKLLGRVRAFFDRRGFLEVETPILSADTVIDRHLDPFALDVGSPGDCPNFRVNENGTVPGALTPALSRREREAVPGVPKRLWLQTSPEFAMKRLLAAGAETIYQVARVFRQGELGPIHNPEFTMVEWYRTGDGLVEGMQLLSDLAETLLERGPAQRLSYAEAFGRHLGLDPHAADPPALAAAAVARGVAVPASFAAADRDDWLDLLMAECVAPKLGTERPEIVFDYPASQAALARVRPGKPPVAERFELFVSGIELANGYHELVDPAELRARNARTNALRAADGKPQLPEESRLLAAMEAGLPPGVGVAMGFDRVVMLAAGASRLADVIAFPMDRA